MELLDAAVNAFIVAAVGSILALLFRGQIGRLERRFDDVPTRAELNARFEAVHAEVKARVEAVHAEVKARVEAVHAEVKARFGAIDLRFEAQDDRFTGLEKRMDRIESGLAALRSDLTQIAMAVGARVRPQTG